MSETIEILRQERDAARAELAARNTAFAEQIDHQSATIDVLKAMSASPGDPQPVFDLIAVRARDVCGAYGVTVYEYDGDLLHRRASTGVSDDPAAHERMRAQYPAPASRTSHIGRVILDRAIVHVRDHAADHFGAQLLQLGVMARSSVNVPLLRDGVAVGALAMGSRATGGFSDSQVTLLQTFAEQAVIAIRSAETFRALEARTAELAARNTQFAEQIDHQSATIDVLKSMSASPSDPIPVFDIIAERARILCNGDTCTVWRYDGALQHKWAQSVGFGQKDVVTAYNATFPRPPSLETPSGRAILTHEIVEVTDLRNGPDVDATLRRMGGRSSLSVPLLHQGTVYGALSLGKGEAGDFSVAQRALLKTFAEQAVIAISSAETFRALEARTAELAARNTAFAEQIDHQAATIDVLKAMSASPGDPQPVFDLIVRRARDLCNGSAVGLCPFDGEFLHSPTSIGADSYASPEARAAYQALYPMRPTRDSILTRAILDRRAIHVRDVAAEPGVSQAVRNLGHKSQLSLPLMHDGNPIGVITLNSAQAGGFTDTQVALLQTFAEQAVIAIKSAETFRALETRTAELQQSLEYQAATIDVLKVMSVLTGDPQPVFETILSQATKLCGCMFGGVQEFDGHLIHHRASIGWEEQALAAYLRQWPLAPSRTTGPGRAILDRRIQHYRDIHAEPEVTPAARALGHRTQINLPLIRGDTVIGVISVAHREVDAVTPAHIELLKTFAEQAVIAIGAAANYRALETRTAELQRSVEYQAATIDVLKVMSSSTNDTQPVFDVILRHAMTLSDAVMGGLFEFDGELAYFRAARGYDPAQLEIAQRPYPRPPSRDTVSERVILDGQLVYLRDYQAEPGIGAHAKGLGIGSLLVVPLSRDGVTIGALSWVSPKIDGFTTAHIDLLKTFAEQAVIAIGTTATFRALQERTAELTQSVAELQALEEVLRAVNASLDLETVLATIINRAVPLAQADEGMIYEFDPVDQIFVPKAAFGMSDARIAQLRELRIRIGETYLGRSAQDRAPVHVADVQNDLTTPQAAEVLQGIHAVLAVPLLRENDVVGGLVIRRHREGAFAPEIVSLMQTFAAQSVLAIENARLFDQSSRARAAAEVALSDLKRAQDRLVQSEKMASLGQLTAGIAHEIKNPLNFVNNFSELSIELLDELRDAVAHDQREEIADLTGLLKSNLDKIAQHGKRADGIVKNMLLHSRESGGDMRAVDLNATVDEALNLAYHGARAEKPGFNITMERNFDPAAGMVSLFPQEFTRVMINMIGNGFYAATKKSGEPNFEPTLTVTTEGRPNEVVIRIRDNGVGIPESARARLFEPFFTTKPAGEGTGLGLSLSHDIVVKQHNGSIAVDSREGAFTEFTVTLPRHMGADEESAR